MYTNHIKVKEMHVQHQAFEHKHAASKISDIFNSHIYQQLLGKRVAMGGATTSHEYFSCPCDVALGLSTDGFCPFKRCHATAWPLILFDYNLAPEI